MELTQTMQDELHEHYLSMRRKRSTGFTQRGVQKSFEELIYSVLQRNAWRSTHISKAAMLAYLVGDRKSIQRAHGCITNRLDRHERTKKLLDPSTPQVEFDEWWHFFLHHDKTILITKSEHSSGKNFTTQELVELPHPSKDMFDNSGFSVRLRVRVEGEWIKKRAREMGLEKTTQIDPFSLP